MRATYSPEDNKCRIYSSGRLDAETYKRVHDAGFRWAPKQELWVAPAWTPAREDLMRELCGEIGDEDTSLVDRAAERAERFGGYSGRRMEDAERAQKAVAAIADGIPMGQPILVGHHSERHARRDAAKIEAGMRRAVDAWETAGYWKARAAGAVRAAKYKERPDVRARRIRTLEAELRKVERTRKDCAAGIEWWTGCDLENGAKVKAYCNLYDQGGVTLADGGSCWSAWSALEDGTITPAEIRAQRLEDLPRAIAVQQRWISHLENRLAYERAMLEADGGTVADKTVPEVGGACQCWASRRGGWSVIQKVNKVSVTIEGRRMTMPLDKLTAVMTAAAVAEARAAGRLIDETPAGFVLGPAGSVDPPVVAPVAVRTVPKLAPILNYRAPEGPEGLRGISVAGRWRADRVETLPQVEMTAAEYKRIRDTETRLSADRSHRVRVAFRRFGEGHGFAAVFIVDAKAHPAPAGDVVETAPAGPVPETIEAAAARYRAGQAEKLAEAAAREEATDKAKESALVARMFGGGAVEGSGASVEGPAPLALVPDFGGVKTPAEVASVETPAPDAGPLFDDTYTGPRWTYGLQYRPAGAFTLPKGWILFSDRPLPRFPFGMIDFPRELTADEVSAFQLAPIGSVAGKGTAAPASLGPLAAADAARARAVAENGGADPCLDCDREGECIDTGAPCYKDAAPGPDRRLTPRPNPCIDCGGLNTSTGTCEDCAREDEEAPRPWLDPAPLSGPAEISEGSAGLEAEGDGARSYTDPIVPDPECSACALPCGAGPCLKPDSVCPDGPACPDPKCREARRILGIEPAGEGSGYFRRVVDGAREEAAGGESPEDPPPAAPAKPPRRGSKAWHAAQRLETMAKVAVVLAATAGGAEVWVMPEIGLGGSLEAAGLEMHPDASRCNYWRRGPDCTSERIRAALDSFINWRPTPVPPPPAQRFKDSSTAEELAAYDRRKALRLGREKATASCVAAVVNATAGGNDRWTPERWDLGAPHGKTASAPHLRAAGLEPTPGRPGFWRKVRGVVLDDSGTAPLVPVQDFVAVDLCQHGPGCVSDQCRDDWARAAERDEETKRATAEAEAVAGRPVPHGTEFVGDSLSDSPEISDRILREKVAAIVKSVADGTDRYVARQWFVGARGLVLSAPYLEAAGLVQTPGSVNRWRYDRNAAARAERIAVAPPDPAAPLSLAPVISEAPGPRYTVVDWYGKDWYGKDWYGKGERGVEILDTDTGEIRRTYNGNLAAREAAKDCCRVLNASGPDGMALPPGLGEVDSDGPAAPSTEESDRLGDARLDQWMALWARDGGKPLSVREVERRRAIARRNAARDMAAALPVPGSPEWNTARARAISALVAADVAVMVDGIERWTVPEWDLGHYGTAPSAPFLRAAGLDKVPGRPDYWRKAPAGSRGATISNTAPEPGILPPARESEASDRSTVPVEAESSEPLPPARDFGAVSLSAAPEISEGNPFERMREALRLGVKVVTAPQLFPTPVDLARRMAELAEVRPGHRILEPSAGTGRLLAAVGLEVLAHGECRGADVVAVEVSGALVRGLREKYRAVEVREADFLGCNGDLGTFDRILMNPPFEKGSDVRHIRHALTMLRPGGRLVALCANGPRQNAELRPLADSWEEIPSGTFSGTGVRVALMVVGRG